MGILIVLVVLEAIALAGLGYRLYTVKKNTAAILENAQEVAKKNIEIEDVAVKGDKQMVALAETVNLIKLNLLAFVESTKGNVITLMDAIDVLSDATKATEHGAEQTSQSIELVSKKSFEQFEDVRDNLELIESNNNQLIQIDSSMKTIQRNLRDTVDNCNTGVSNLTKYEANMGIIQDNLKQCVTILGEFNQQISKVNSIGEIVVGISDELQLLALNASIEAARAGEAGRGFTVVSSEMGAMSEQTKDNMNEITGILGRIVESSQLVTQSINECHKAFTQSTDLFAEVSDSFKEISEQSNGMNNRMEDMTSKYNMIAENSNRSKVKAEGILAASSVISDNTKEVVSISQETTQESNRMTSHVDALEDMLTLIRNLVKQFKAGAVPTENNRSQTVKIAFFSKLDNYFWFSIRRGVLYAQKELRDNNVEITYFPYKDDIEEKNFPLDVNTCINEQYDAIIYPGFLTLANKQLSNAARVGIKIFTYNCDCDSSIGRISCYEPDQEEAGIMAADAVAKAIHKSGNVAIVLGDKTMAVNKIRYDSFCKRIADKYKDIRIVETIEVTYNGQQTYAKEVDLLKRRPELNAIYSTTGMQTELASAIVDTGNKGKVKAVVFDHNDDIFRYISEGVIAAAIDHDPFSQGHDPIIYMYNHIVDGFELPRDRMKCKASVVDSDNIAERVSTSK